MKNIFNWDSFNELRIILFHLTPQQNPNNAIDALGLFVGKVP